jgi:hypothetical protein
MGVDKKKHYDKRNDITFPKVNPPFISSNIPASPAYGVGISQLISRACPIVDFKVKETVQSRFLSISNILNLNVYTMICFLQN